MSNPPRIKPSAHPHNEEHCSVAMHNPPRISGTGFSVCLLKSNTESCDEDGGEVVEGLVEVELAD